MVLDAKQYRSLLLSVFALFHGTDVEDILRLGVSSSKMRGKVAFSAFQFYKTMNHSSLQVTLAERCCAMMPEPF